MTRLDGNILGGTEPISYEIKFDWSITGRPIDSLSLCPILYSRHQPDTRTSNVAFAFWCQYVNSDLSVVLTLDVSPITTRIVMNILHNNTSVFITN